MGAAASCTVAITRWAVIIAIAPGILTNGGGRPERASAAVTDPGVIAIRHRRGIAAFAGTWRPAVVNRPTKPVRMTGTGFAARLARAAAGVFTAIPIHTSTAGAFVIVAAGGPLLFQIGAHRAVAPIIILARTISNSGAIGVATAPAAGVTIGTPRRPCNAARAAGAGRCINDLLPRTVLADAHCTVGRIAAISGTIAITPITMTSASGAFVAGVFPGGNGDATS